jgi:hypothetical protein
MSTRSASLTGLLKGFSDALRGSPPRVTSKSSSVSFGTRSSSHASAGLAQSLMVGSRMSPGFAAQAARAGHAGLSRVVLPQRHARASSHANYSNLSASETSLTNSSTLTPISTWTVFRWRALASLCTSSLKRRPRASRFSNARAGSPVLRGMSHVVPRLSNAAFRNSGVARSHTAWWG